MKKQGGQIEWGITSILSLAGALAVVVSIATTCSLGSFNYGKLSQRVEGVQIVVAAQQEKVDKIPVLEGKLEWVMKRLDQIADAVNAPKAKE